MTGMALARSEVNDQRPFEGEAAGVMQRLRETMSAVIESIPASGTGEIRRAADLQRALGIRNSLAWQVYRLAHAPDPLIEASSVPGRAAMKSFLEAASSRGVERRQVQAASAAMKEFHELVETHAGDRRTFDSMVSGLTAAGSQQVDFTSKRAAFRANSHIWGVQAKTRLACYLYHPAADAPDRIDAAGIRGLHRLRRLRRNAPWVVSRFGASDNDGVTRRTVVCEPLDPMGKAGHGVALLRDFCSRPLPTFRTVSAALGVTSVEIEGESVGNMSAVTCFIGDVARAVLGRYQDENNRYQASQALIRTPCETLIQDVLVYDGTFGEISPQVMVYGDHRSGDAVSGDRACDLLALRETVDYLGRGPSVLRTPALPRYPEMVQYALDRLGWDGRRFDVYRCRVEYPVMPSSVVVRFDLPKPPGDTVNSA